MNNRNKFFVHIDTGDGKPVVAGYFQLDHSKNTGVFFYGKSYCENPSAFPIDPINLPLVYNKHFRVPVTRFNQTAIPGVILDSGPDEWGKRIINRLADPKPMTAADYLVMGSGFGVGAIYFSDKADPIEPASLNQDSDLLQLYRSAIALDEDQQDLSSVANYLMPSSGIGGARPKAPWSIENTPCIAKFNRKDDPFDNALAEYCMMKLASEINIECAQVHLQKTDVGNVVLVERFDIDKDRRRHILSANAALNLTDIEQLNQVSYDRIAAIGQKIGSAEGLAEQLFTRMLFNIAIGNTDDHTRNHSFIKSLKTHSYQLSPAYDLVPVPYRIGAHAINIGPFGQSPTLDNITSAGRLMGLNAQQQQACAQSIYKISHNLSERLEALGMPQEDIKYLQPCFAQAEKIEMIANA